MQSENASAETLHRPRYQWPDTRPAPWRPFFAGGQYQHKSRPIVVLAGEAAMGAPAARYAELPKVAAKRRRALVRALKRGKPSQIQRCLTAYTGIQAP